MRQVAERDGRVLHILDPSQLGSCVHGRNLHGLANKILLVDGKISGTVVFRQRCVPCECRECIGPEFPQFLLRKDIHSVQLGDRQLGDIGAAKGRGIFHVTLVGTPTVAARPIAVNAASLAVAAMLRKGSDASLLLQWQVGKVRTHQCRNFGNGVVRTRPSIVFCLLPGAIGSPRFGRPRLSLGRH